MTNHKVTAFAEFDDFVDYVESLDGTTIIHVSNSPEKGWIVVE
jgi:hypothetical protein